MEISTCVTVTYSSVAEEEFVGRTDCSDVIRSKYLNGSAAAKPGCDLLWF